MMIIIIIPRSMSIAWLKHSCKSLSSGKVHVFLVKLSRFVEGPFLGFVYVVDKSFVLC